jgi:cellulose synthase (UDP-forming)
MTAVASDFHPMPDLTIIPTADLGTDATGGSTRAVAADLRVESRQILVEARLDARRTIDRAAAAARSIHHAVDAARHSFDVARMRRADLQDLHAALQARLQVSTAALTAAIVNPDDPAAQLPLRPTRAHADRRPARLVPVLGAGRELALRAATLAAAAATAWFWLWWISSGAGTWTALTITVSVVLGWLFLMPFYFLMFACRMTRVDPALPRPDLRVAMVVTKVPSEPWPLVVRTLEAMLAQEPGGHDVWLADENPTAETLQWCLARRVLVSSRRLAHDYHQPEWPRRARSKEGNLSFFYDRVGYDAYDVVVQLDVDHVPAPGYLSAMVRPFADPAVGYVSAPSICDANRDRGWTVRGRLFKEATWHGPVQAGCNGGWAPLCIGSHYAVRTAALREVGGLGPELAEDYSTTLWLQSGGWEGVFSLDAEAHGDGPESFDEMMLQEIQWARSLGALATRWAPVRFGRLRWRAAARLGFTLAYYPLQGITLAVAAVLPVTGTGLGRSWGNTSFLQFYVHFWPFSLATFVALLVVRGGRVLRPVDGKVLSWEVALFQIVRWPWNLWSFLQGAWAGLRRRSRPFRITPKGTSELKSLSLRYLAPILALAVVPAVAVLFHPYGTIPIGPALLAIAESATYLVAAVAVVVLHIHQNARRRRGLVAAGGAAPKLVGLRTGGTAAAVVALIVVALGLSAVLVP